MATGVGGSGAMMVKIRCTCHDGFLLIYFFAVLVGVGCKKEHHDETPPKKTHTQTHTKEKHEKKKTPTQPAIHSTTKMGSFEQRLGIILEHDYGTRLARTREKAPAQLRQRHSQDGE